MHTTHPTSTALRTPATSRTNRDAWLEWRPQAAVEPYVLTIAELAECLCPDLCNRDHANE